MILVVNTTTQFHLKFSRIAVNGAKGCCCHVERLQVLPQDESITEAKGTSFCSPNDLENPGKGRRIALSRALKTMGMPREDRRLFWEKYIALDRKKGVLPRLKRPAPEKEVRSHGVQDKSLHVA